MARRILLAVVLLAAVIVVVRLAMVAREFDTVVTAAGFDAARDNHTELRAFLHRMPKGGDLHTHLSGAVYAERFIAWAAQQHLCADPANTLLSKPECDLPGDVPATDGYFIPPTIVADIDEHSRLVQEEQFGPIVQVLKFTDDEDALRRANDTRYGLSGSVWSSNPDRAAALASRLEVGTAWVNQHRSTSATVPFGGAKESGIGRVYSEMGLKAYLEPRVISVLKSA